MSKIGIDLSIANINQAGTGIYASSLLNALRQIDKEHDYCVFRVRQQRDMSSHKTLHSRLKTIFRDIVWMHGILPWQVSRSKVDLLHMPANVMPLFSSCPTVVTILDTTVLQSSQNFPFWQRNYSRVFIPWTARHASMILTISEHSKQDIVRHLGVVSDKVAVTYLAAVPAFQVISSTVVSEVKLRYNLKLPFALAVGTLEPRKNLVRLLQAFSLLRQNVSSLQLVHAGPRGWLFDDVMQEVERLGLQDSVHFLGRVPLDDLVGLYNAASVFVYPSLYEGFGLPVLEAMSCGCPVITSDISSLPEVTGDAAVLIDPYNVQQLAEAIQRVVEDKNLFVTMRQRGLDRAKLFSWERCAQETLAVYHRLLEKGES